MNRPRNFTLKPLALAMYNCGLYTIKLLPGTTAMANTERERVVLIAPVAE